MKKWDWEESSKIESNSIMYACYTLLENNNDNNLFTSMFGIESEEPKEPVIEQPVQEQPAEPEQ